MKRLKKQSEFIDTVKPYYEKNEYPVFKNPTPQECQILLEDYESGGRIKIVVTDSGDVYACPGNIIHDSMMRLLNITGLRLIINIKNMKIENDWDYSWKELKMYLAKAKQNILNMGLFKEDPIIATYAHSANDENFDPFIGNSWEDGQPREVMYEYAENIATMSLSDLLKK